uniref:Uncharacterized protein n=1 Tax=Solibacter usitatus (strain Ellin6076) TaxID=234267 RepID=Q01V44_SOLUE
MNSPMKMAVVLMAFSAIAFGQTAAQPPALGYKDSYQLDYMDIRGTINFTNTGLHPNLQSPPNSSDICVNAYVFQPVTDSPDGPLGAAMASCCSCRVAASTVRTITPQLSGPVVVKLVATMPSRSGPACDATVLPTLDLGLAAGYAAGLRAWSVSQPTVLSEQVSTSKFDKVPLGSNEQAKLTQLCAATASKCTCQ